MLNLRGGAHKRLRPAANAPHCGLPLFDFLLRPRYYMLG